MTNVILGMAGGGGEEPGMPWGRAWMTCSHFWRSMLPGSAPLLAMASSSRLCSSSITSTPSAGRRQPLQENDTNRTSTTGVGKGLCRMGKKKARQCTQRACHDPGQRACRHLHPVMQAPPPACVSCLRAAGRGRCPGSPAPAPVSGRAAPGAGQQRRGPAAAAHAPPGSTSPWSPACRGIGMCAVQVRAPSHANPAAGALHTCMSTCRERTAACRGGQQGCGTARHGGHPLPTCAWKRDSSESNSSWGGGVPYMPASGSATAAAASSAASSAPQGTPPLPPPPCKPCRAALSLHGGGSPRESAHWAPPCAQSARAPAPLPEAPTAEAAAEDVSEGWRCACMALSQSGAPCCSAGPAAGAACMPWGAAP